MAKIQGLKVPVLLHIAAWAIILGLPLYNFYRWDIPKQFVWGFYTGAIINAMIFYGNYLFLIPRYFFKEMKLRYYLAAFILLVSLFFGSVFINRLTYDHGSENEPRDRFRQESAENSENPATPARDRRTIRIPFGSMHLYNFTFNALAFTIFALGLRVLERHAHIEKRQKELEKEKLNSELAFLKNQISPHFFFNTLNNIYSLISINTGDSQDAVLKLSRLMRYLLYESEQGEIKLSSEIDFMNNYIDLMRLRLSDKVKLNVSFPSDYGNITIPPLLFISIVENAFKHGISYREKSFIDIAMEVSEEMINFNCVNSVVTASKSESTDNSGIGLDNLQKRLKLLFPEKHEFNIEKSESTYHVTVCIFLAKT